MEIKTEKKEDSIVLKLEGKVDTITSPAVQGAILNSFQKTRSLVLDFEKVDYISSAGVRALLIGEKTAKGKGGYMKLIHVPDIVMEILILTGFTKILQIEKD